MKNRNSLYVLVLFVLLLLIGVGLWIVKGRLGGLEEAEKSERKLDEYYEEVSSSFRTDDVIKKGVVKDEKRVSFLFTGVMVDGLELQSWGGLTGKVIVDGDELRREIPVAVNNTQTYLGIFENSLEGNSVWNLQDNEKVAELINPESNVFIQIIHDYVGDEKYIEYLYNHDLVLDELLDDITSKRWKYDVPGDFELHFTDIGIVL